MPPEAGSAVRGAGFLLFGPVLGAGLAGGPTGPRGGPGQAFI